RGGGARFRRRVFSPPIWRGPRRKRACTVPVPVALSPRGRLGRFRRCRTVRSWRKCADGHMGRKIALIGGGGVRTPLVIFGIHEASKALGADELVLFDPDMDRVQVMAELGRALVASEGGTLRIRQAATIEEAVADASFVLNSIRVGGMQARVHDEQVAVAHGYPGQETTGPGGVAMALRTVRIAVEQARLVERLSSKAWIVNFTNPAGLITQAIKQNSNARIVRIC